MLEETKIRGLAGAAGYLCSAHDELLAAGYDAWSGELRELIEIIGAEMGWLRERETGVSP